MPEPSDGCDDAVRGDRAHAEESLRKQPVIEKFELGAAGAPIREAGARVHAYSEYMEGTHRSEENPWAPFASKLDWELARWAKLRGPSSTALTELLQIEGVRDLLGLTYKDADSLNKIVDSLPGRPKFHRKEVVVAGEAFEVYFRDVMECVRALYGDPEFVADLVFAPERHYVDQDKTVRMYSDLHTGKWWWATQKELERDRPGATIVPVIISSDKTQITLFGNKSAYPIYMTIGNLPKEIRRKPSRGGHILLGYLPTSRLDHITNQAARRRTLANLFHSCVRRILRPLKKAGETGVVMARGDGVCRRTHPLFAMFVGDYPEQVLVTGTKTGQCPRCPVPHDQLGEYDSFEFRDMDAVLEALASIAQGPGAFVKACAHAGIKPTQHPFWEGLPYVNIFQSITPDILHQLYQGVMKHVISWVTNACGAAEIDARCRRFPPNHHIRLFTKGISTLSKVTGREHAQMCQLLLGLITDIRLPDGLSSARLVRATRAILDFCYLAQYPVHTDDTLKLLEVALQAFHENKGIFVDLGIRNDFNLPKLHALLHYFISIKIFGTTDNYNTEYTERLHIDFTKDAYRATNHKDEYPQMTRWLERREKVLRHDKYVRWRIAGSPASNTKTGEESGPRDHLRMTRHPSLKAVPLSTIRSDYGAIFFSAALARFVVQYHQPQLTRAQIENAAASLSIRFQTVPVYHKIKFWNRDPFRRKSEQDSSDAVHVRPVRQDSRGRAVPARFDTVLVNLGTASNGSGTSLQGYRIAQVRLVFSVPPRGVATLFKRCPPEHLAYVEWFSPFSSRPDRKSGMYKVTRSIQNGERLASIIPVSQIERSIHLFPKWGPVAPREWSSSTVLDLAPAFFVNPFLDRHTFVTFL
ncbi:hypothetical protein GLOTRDRAFT_50393 [Gloeophyllum trabeum ATCC 11539]|uniref:Uncharacterized protein n=1 Tax=Gloeophyllum trabeum (strain ATCC 11539 / FP-39264 / Madison 617) TaxID=670483 RepID=S7RDU8_GLOTA|nr:uncharacterized protein GLOTRDRAFT_50393 [Gloeophyllum trabeum ATCC 11539]EPQ50619.1 hypothetical protein GLOTRDRAFT_50393 [Gloeophyllum trabeum ATCC 11539]